MLFISFGTPNFSQARYRLITSFERFGATRYFPFDSGSPAIMRAWAENREIMDLARGYGYWLWKPYIIEETMNHLAQPNEVIMYTDIAVEMVGSPLSFIDIMAVHDVSTFHVPGHRKAKVWTKRDAFILLDADTEEYWEEEQVSGAWLCVRNNKRAREFIEEWKQAIRDPRILTDAPNTCGVQNFPEFIDHRHDQSALTILGKRANLPIFADPSQFGRETGITEMRLDCTRFVPLDCGQIFNHHRLRDSGLPHN